MTGERGFRLPSSTRTAVRVVVPNRPAPHVLIGHEFRSGADEELIGEDRAGADPVRDVEETRRDRRGVDIRQRSAVHLVSDPLGPVPLGPGDLPATGAEARELDPSIADRAGVGRRGIRRRPLSRRLPVDLRRQRALERVELGERGVDRFLPRLSDIVGDALGVRDLVELLAEGLLVLDEDLASVVDDRRRGVELIEQLVEVEALDDDRRRGRGLRAEAGLRERDEDDEDLVVDVETADRDRPAFAGLDLRAHRVLAPIRLIGVGRGVDLDDVEVEGSVDEGRLLRLDIVGGEGAVPRHSELTEVLGERRRRRDRRDLPGDVVETAVLEYNLPRIGGNGQRLTGRDRGLPDSDPASGKRGHPLVDLEELLDKPLLTAHRSLSFVCSGHGQRRDRRVR